jgi:hypothetical protein
MHTVQYNFTKRKEKKRRYLILTFFLAIFSLSVAKVKYEWTEYKIVGTHNIDTR